VGPRDGLRLCRGKRKFFHSAEIRNTIPLLCSPQPNSLYVPVYINMCNYTKLFAVGPKGRNYCQSIWNKCAAVEFV
jgi:hypothetical protein